MTIVTGRIAKAMVVVKLNDGSYMWISGSTVNVLLEETSTHATPFYQFGLPSMIARADITFKPGMGFQRGYPAGNPLDDSALPEGPKDVTPPRKALPAPEVMDVDFEVIE